METEEGHSGAGSHRLPPNMRRYANSPAVGVIPAGTVGLCEGAVACNAGASDETLDDGIAPLVHVVDTVGDAGAANPGDGVCASTAGGCTLRAALEEANARPLPAVFGVAHRTHQGQGRLSRRPGSAPARPSGIGEGRVPWANAQLSAAARSAERSHFEVMRRAAPSTSSPTSSDSSGRRARRRPWVRSATCVDWVGPRRAPRSCSAQPG
jgi:CSLREA domain-containing protein